MPTNAETLDLFFGLDGKDGKAPEDVAKAVRAAVAAQIHEGANAIAAARVFADKMPATQLDLAATEVIGLLRRSMNSVSIPQVLFGAWNKYSALRKYADASKYPPDQPYIESFLKQTVTSKHHPFVELRLGGEIVGKVVFDVEVEVTFEEVSLTICGGKIVTAQPGKASASGAIKYKGQPMLKRPLGEFTIPGEIHFNSGILLDPQGKD